MPFALKDVEKHNKGLGDKQKAQWMAVANSVYAKCIKDGGDDKSCAPKAIQQANGVVATHSESEDEDIGFYKELASNYEIRYEMYKGKQRIVVPVIMMQAGVHAGSHGPLLHLAEDLGKFPASWDGIPISIQHPQENGNNVSANQPHIIDNQVVGRVFNTHMEDGKLKAEAWIDQDRIQQISPEALKYIQDGKPLDVSVGVFTEDEYSTGDYNGEHYEGIAKNHRPDHLALLPGGRGACSWTDGCGVRANAAEEGVTDMQINASRPKFTGTEKVPWTGVTLSDFNVTGQWADQTPADKSMIASHFLIGHGDAPTFEALKLPVVNPHSHKLNEGALRAVISGRGDAVTGVSPSEKSGARRMAYDLLNSEFDAKLTIPTTLEFVPVLDRKLLKALAAFGVNVSVNPLSFDDITESIQEKLSEMDTVTKVNYLKETFPDYFIYCKCPAQNDATGLNVVEGPAEMEGDLFKQTYNVLKDNTIEFTGEAQPVVKKVEYITMKQGEIIMTDKKKGPCCSEQIELMIQSDLGLFTEADRPVLEALGAADNAQIDKMLAMMDKLKAAMAAFKEVEGPETDAAGKKKKTPAGEQAGGNPNVPAANAEVVQELQALKAQLSDPDKVLALLPAETRATMEHGMRLYKAEREKKIGHILANTNSDVYSQGRLSSMADQDLDDLYRAIKAPANYAPLGPQTNVNADEMLLPPGVA